MSKHVALPTLRLISFGSAKAQTNGPNDGPVLEINLVDFFKQG
jgi:hypothetical protein